MAGLTFLLLAALASNGPAPTQDPAVKPPPAAAPARPAAQVFPAGAEVLSVDGEPLGVLTGVETRPAGERILHIRRGDGSMTWAPATVASRGERAVVLDWTRSEFEASAAVSPDDAVSVPAAPSLN